MLTCPEDGFSSPRHGIEDGALAAAGRADDGKELAVTHLDVDITHGGEFAEGHGHLVEGDHGLCRLQLRRAVELAHGGIEGHGVTSAYGWAAGAAALARSTKALV